MLAAWGETKLYGDGPDFFDHSYLVITPPEADERGCQLSIQVQEHPKELFAKLEAARVKCDFREPNVIRVAPTPLYNTFHEVWRFARILAEHQ